MAGTGSLDQTGGRNKFPLWDYKKLKKVRNNSSTIRVLGILWVLGALVNVAMGVMLILGGDAIPILGAFYVGCGMLVGLASAGALTRAPWGKVPGTIVCGLLLFGFPIGTLIGALGLVAFTEKESLFGEGRISHADLEEEYKYRKRNKIN